MSNKKPKIKEQVPGIGLCEVEKKTAYSCRTGFQQAKLKIIKGVIMNGAIALLCLIWGLNWVVMKQANQVFPPVLFTTYRFILGSGVLLIVTYFKKIPIPRREDWKWVILGGILQTAFFNTAVQVGMQFLSAGFSSVLSYSMPFWVAIMAHFLLGEKLTRRKMTGVAMGMVGLVALLNVSGGGAWWAIVLTLTGAVAWAFSSILVKLKLQHCDILQYTTWQMVVGAIVLSIYSALFGHGTIQWGWYAVGCLVYNGVLASALAYFLWTYILSNTEAGKASISMLIIPIIGVLAGVIFLKETLYWNTVVGMALILGGIWLVNGHTASREIESIQQGD
ncbi:DMT family transporter [Thermosinus carboxydivorans]|nr:EamA family transporter [Thermosinus carboxydivorans]